MKINTLDYFSITETIRELSKVGNTKIVNKLLEILNANEIPKSEKHNRKNDIRTSYFKIDLSVEYLDEIRNLFLDLEVESLTVNGETGPQTGFYTNLLDKWSNLSV